MDHAENYDKIKDFLEEKLEEAGAEAYVLGISGGMDSAVAAKTVVEMLGSDKLVGWVMPGEPSREENMEDARELAENLGIELRDVSIEPVVQQFCQDAPFELDKLTEGNVRARVRMVYEYMDANQNDLMVLGAGNRSELMLGYFTKYGDGAVDVSPFLDLYKTELKEFAEFIGLDEKFIEKKPTAGLWEGQKDEEEIGMPYEKVDPVLKKLVEEEMDPDEVVDRTEFQEKQMERVNEMYMRSGHKRKRPPYPDLR